MAFAISEGRTVLWDQFQYTGAPEEFSWVLPVAPGAYLELSSDAWFDALETTTAVTVLAPQLNCASRGSSGCAGSDRSIAVNDSAGAFFNPGVSVLRQESVGPYDTVTLRSSSGDELTNWLLQNGYLVPEDVVPIIAAYVSDGADFIALKLRPAARVQQMAPVRVITPEGPPILPLRMVAAGAAEAVDIVLYVIGDRRFSMPDFTEVSVDTSALSYDFASATSDYLRLRQAALSFNGGQAFLTALAVGGFFSPSGSGPPGRPDFATTYFNLAFQDRGIQVRRQCDDQRESLDADRLVVPDCDATTPEPCAPLGADELRAGELSCAEFDDLSAALLGQRPSETWLTRLELRVPRVALSSDCVIEPSSKQREVSNLVQATRFDNPPCDLPVFSSSLSGRAPRAPGAALLGALLAAAVLRRSRARRG